MTSLVFGLRLGRWGLVGFSLTALLLNLTQTVGYYQIAGHTAAQRAAFGASMSAVAAQLVALFPTPIRPDTVGGYVQFRGFGALAVLFAVWAVASATGAARGDEDRGIVEAELASGVSRIALVASRSAAFALAVVVAAAGAGAGFALGVLSGGETVPPGGVLGSCAMLAALGLACYAICFLVAQIATARSAAAAAGVGLLALFLLNSLSRVISGLTAWRWLSPFRYYELSQPLPPGGHLDGRALLVLLLIAAGCAALAAVAFAWRDLGASLIPLRAMPGRAGHTAARLPLWSVAVLRGVFERRLGLLAWCAGMAVLGVVFVALTKTIVQVLLSVPSLGDYLSIFVHQQLYPAVLGYTWFAVAQLMFAALAITYVARWAAEDTDGRLEMLLSAPASRAAIVVERMLTLAAVALVVAAVSAIAVSYASHNAGIDLNTARVTAACLMLVPFALVFAGAGSLLAAWNPRAAVPLLGAFALASYLDDELAVVFKLPVWVQDLSAFRLMGAPLLHGADGRNLAILIALALAGLGSSILAMQRRDVGA